MAKARAFALPGALEDAGDVLKLHTRKDPDGKRLLNKFSIPRNPTKTDKRRRITPAEDQADAARLYDYNGTDIKAEAEASSRCPDLPPAVLEFWLNDQEINFRGVAVDPKGLADAIAIVEQAFERYNAELRAITGGAVEKASQLERLKAFLATRGVHVDSLDEEHMDALLKVKGMDPWAYRALEIRAAIGSASIKKLFAIRNQKTLWNRLHDLFSFHGARTGRATGNGPQPQNLPKAGPDVFGPNPKDASAFKCCGRFFGAHTHVCPWCGVVWPPTAKKLEWSAEVHADAFTILATRSLACAEMYFGDALLLIAGCLRGLFVAGDGHDLIASDFSAIEAVVLAALAGEEWRLDVFRNKKDIYLASAAKITGNTYEFYADYKKNTGQHHPHRQPFGKVAELSSGYGGWIGAWLSFGAGEYFSEQEMKTHILAWRDASPAIVEFWGGQFRGLPWETGYRAERFGLEGAAVNAVQYPGTEFTVCAQHPASRPISFVVKDDVLYCRLPSGRYLTYHQPRLVPASRGLHKAEDGALSLSYMTWNTNPKMGPAGWVRVDTYGGKLCENVVQAVSFDILAYAIINIQRAGYPVVLHVHDEIVAEVVKGWGSVEEFERIMGTLPPFANDNQGEAWPLRCAGGWRGYRYRKD